MPNAISSKVTGGAAITAVSPMALGGETKDQDRACWFAATRTATVADGVTSAPRSADAAELAVQLSPFLFHGNAPVDQRLQALADLLIARRLEAQALGMKAGSEMPAAIHAMLEEAAREKLASSYQTTLVSACFVPGDRTIATTVVNVGDAAFFAFDRDGDLLFTTLPSPPAPEVKRPSASGKPLASLKKNSSGFEFGPGACLLCRVLGDAGEYPDLARSADIRPGSAGSWLIVTPIDQLQPADRRAAASTIAPRLIGSGGIALVPRYLTQALSDGGCEALCCMNYSRHIRYPEDPPQPKPILSGKGHTTQVLPDHVRAGHWLCVNERFPSDSSFLLCSDGFYSAFDDPRKMWLWLTDHEAALRHPRQQQTVMRQLHEHLHQTAGDDDISLIWVSGTRLMAGQGGEVDDGR
ncbi:MAG: protein phosphatase 2C domain-containing protein [Sterolibacterium sp.]